MSTVIDIFSIMISPTFCTWPIGLPDAVAKLQYKEKVLDFAVTLGRALGPHGLAHRLIGNIEHVARYGVNGAPLADPGPYLPGDAAAVANHKRAVDLYDIQQKLDPILEMSVEAGWPKNQKHDGGQPFPTSSQFRESIRLCPRQPRDDTGQPPKYDGRYKHSVHHRYEDRDPCGPAAASDLPVSERSAAHLKPGGDKLNDEVFQGNHHNTARFCAMFF